jgi:hypothetical protein
VLTYAFAFGFFKLVNYVLFFWLPFFLSQHFDPSTSNLISTLYDIGMMPVRSPTRSLSCRALALMSEVCCAIDCRVV